ncbi:MAG: exo-alpha-sialidase [Verrucomicrobia bacterium]|nr:exo-alpha-sialidase [Verrucomicrobiota bacterium]
MCQPSTFLTLFLGTVVLAGSAPGQPRRWPLERMSSGALLRLDREGDLVKPPTDSPPRLPNAGGMLDPRIGANVRIGDDPPALPSVRRAQAEPHALRNRFDPDVILATFQEGRFTNGGAITCGYGLSTDGGKTWTRALIPSLGTGQGGIYQRATDPVAGFRRDGTLVLNTLASVTAAFEVAAVTISRAAPGGAFGTPIEVYRGPSDGSIFPDKNWMAINTNASGLAAGRILVTWTQFLPGDNDPSPIVRSYSDDGGNTWTPPAPIHAAGTFSQGSQPVFLPDGRAAVVYWNFGQPGLGGTDHRVECVTSADGGVTWNAPVRAANATLYGEPAIRTGAFLPSAVADESSASIYVTYVSQQSGTPRVMFVRSRDAGATWDAPVVASDNPGTGLFNPAITVSPDGTRVVIVFHDRRLNPNSTTLYDTFVAQSFDGGTTWQPNLRVSSVTSDASLAPLTGAGYMVGDYLGIAGPRGSQIPAVPVWVDTRSGNPDPYSARVAAAATFDFAAWQSAYFSQADLQNAAVSGSAADPDGDGEDNQSEFTSGTNPFEASSVVRSAKAVNLSTRARVQTGENLVIGGFVVSGTQPKPVVIRAVGPSLANFGITDPLLDPNLELRDAGGNLVATNEDWADTQAAEIQASGFAPVDAREAAIRATLAPGSYTALVRGRNNTSGVAVVEAYDVATGVAARLINVSTRARVEGGQNVSIGGFVVGAGLGTAGAGSVRVVVRAIGPSLAAAGVSAPLLDPTLELRSAAGELLASNDDWQQTQAAEIAAAGLAPTDVREAAIVRVLPRGSYTAIVRGKNDAVGVALVEVYEVP